MAALLVVAAAWLVMADTNWLTFPGDFETAVDSTQFVKIEKPVVKYGMLVNGLDIKQGEVKRNQLFADLFAGAYLPPARWQQINLLPKQIFDFRKIVPARKFTLITQNDSLHTAVALVYEPSPVDYVIFHLKDTLRVEVCAREIKTEEKSITGTIQSSLYETIDAQKISPELTNKFVDVFGWQVDFQHLQKGDRFKLIYEEHSVEGAPYSIGQIKGIYFEHFGHRYFAFPFDQGAGIDYFDEEGNSLRKALLKYPIEFTRISSRYSMSRFHPVAKVFRAHLGTDFAAATGTPIRSVGDGIVQEAQYTANNGNHVKIRHNGTYTTGYLHMSKIGAGITAGAHVRQGQTIGYVGSTGLATGPHLCYRFWRNGVQVDALRVELPPSQPVEKENWETFQDVKRELILRLQSISFDATSDPSALSLR